MGGNGRKRWGKVRATRKSGNTPACGGEWVLRTTTTTTNDTGKRTRRTTDDKEKDNNDEATTVSLSSEMAAFPY
jgi:hypothetical protein